MEKNLTHIYEVLQKLIGLHRQLLEKVRQEREALVAVNIPLIQEITHSKESLIEMVRQEESKRLKYTGELAIAWKKPLRELTLPSIIIAIQGQDSKTAEQLRSSYNALSFLIQRIDEQNQSNKRLIQESLKHVENMKKNVLGEAAPRSEVYTQQGQKTAGASGASRLISKEV